MSNVEIEKSPEKRVKIHDTRARKAQKVTDNSTHNNMRSEDQEQALGYKLDPEYANMDLQTTSENLLASEILTELETESSGINSGISDFLHIENAPSNKCSTPTTNHLQTVEASNESEANNIVTLMDEKDKNEQVAISLLVKTATEASAAEYINIIMKETQRMEKENDNDGFTTV
ncbi:11688_t:CDS:2, partial [Cetraspora pellucida]